MVGPVLILCHTALENIRTDNSGASDTGTSSLTLSVVLPESQKWIPSEEMIAPSGATIALGIIGSVGGAFVSVSGVFALIFGRGVWEVVAGKQQTYYFSVPRHFLMKLDLRRWSTCLPIRSVWTTPGIQTSHTPAISPAARGHGQRRHGELH